MYSQPPFNVMMPQQQQQQQQQSPSNASTAPGRPTESISPELGKSQWRSSCTVKLIRTLLASMFKRDKDGQLLWFAGPPAHVTPTSQPVHSVAYLEWKRKQQQQQQQQRKD